MSSDPVNDYASSIVKRRIASLCLALGWNSTHSSAMDIMQDLMVRYIKLIGTDVKQRAELCNRTQPDIVDLQSTFDDMGINVEELSEYVEQFDCRALVTDPVPIFPQPSETHLNYLKPGSREVLHRPYHIYDYLPPMYPEMEGTEDTNMNTMATNLDDNKVEIKTEAPAAQPGDSSDLHPLREIASVIMTSSGFISETREGRMADSKTPVVRQMSMPANPKAGNESTGSQPGPSLDHGKTPLAPTKAKPSKAAEDTDSEGIIDDSDDDFKEITNPPGQVLTPASTPAKPTGSKLSVFQKNKKAATPKSPKTPKTPKPPKPPKAEKNKDKTPAGPPKPKGKPGRPPGRKNKVEKITTPQTTSKEFISSSDSDSSPERKQKPEKPPKKEKPEVRKPEVVRKPEISQPPLPQPPPAKKVKIEPPVELNVDITSLPAPDPSILPNNPLIPKAFFGFENMNSFEPVPPPAPLPPPPQPMVSTKPEKPEKIVEPIPEKPVKAKSEPQHENIVKPVSDKKAEKSNIEKDSEKKKEKKKEKALNKALKKAKKEKKEKNREKEKKEKSDHAKEGKEKSEKKDKEKKSKKKDKQEKSYNPPGPELFAGTDQITITKSVKSKTAETKTPKPPKAPSVPKTPVPSVPKLKIKDFVATEPPAVSLPPAPAPTNPVSVVASSSAVTEPPKASPKIVFKNLGVDKKKDPPKQVDLFSDSVHISHGDRPKSSMSETSDSSKLKAALSTPTISTKKDKKENKESSKDKKEKSESSESSRKRSSSGGGKRNKEKPGSNPVAEAAIRVPAPIPEEVTPDPGTPTFGGGSVVTQTVGYYVDAEGNQIWICPACGKPDDGSPMIGCDECDDWYHWVCVGISAEPADNQDWFCPRCVIRKSTMFMDRKPSSSSKRGRPPKVR